MPEYVEGDTVRYKPVGGPESKTSESVGVVREVRIASANLTGRQVEASEEEPRYEIENLNTRRRSAIKESNILGPAE